MNCFRSILLISGFILIVVSCKHKKEEVPDLGYNYAPVTLGKFVIYDVDSTIYDDFFGDTIYYKYRIKEKLEETYLDNEGRSAIKLVRYIKKYDPLISYDNIPWSIKDVWNYTKTNTTLEVVEENQRITKLSFPVIEGKSWNGNANNSMDASDYSYKYINQKENINGKMFENVLYVEQKDDKKINVIHRQFYIEKYAKDIGLVYKEIKDLQSSAVTVTNGIPDPVETRITKGVIYKMNYINHGIE